MSEGKKIPLVKCRQDEEWTDEPVVENERKMKDKKEKGKIKISIGDNLIERILNLVERSAESEEEDRFDKKEWVQNHLDFINTQTERVENKLNKLDPTDKEYYELLSVYDKLTNIVRWW